MKKGRRRAYYLLQIGEAFDGRNVSEAILQEIGWTKLLRIAPIVTDANIANAAKELATAEETNVHKDRKIEQLQTELAERDDAARKQLDETLRGFDDRLASLARQMEQAGPGKGRSAAKGGDVST